MLTPLTIREMPDSLIVEHVERLDSLFCSYRDGGDGISSKEQVLHNALLEEVEKRGLKVHTEYK